MKINSGQAPSTLIPEYIGTDFDKVITVADNLNDIKTVSTNINDVVAVGDNILDVNTVAADVEVVTLVADNIDYVKDVAEGIEGLPVSGYIGDTPPTQPKVGATWYCTLDGRNYTWYEDTDSGQWVESSPQSTADDPHLAGNIFTLWKRSAAEAGYNLVVGSFEEGGVLTSSTDVLWHKGLDSIYSWTGAFPKTVAPGTDPAAVAGFVMRSDAVLRSELASSDGAGLSGFSHSETYIAGTVGAKLKQAVAITDKPHNAISGEDNTAALDSAALAADFIFLPPGVWSTTNASFAYWKCYGQGTLLVAGEFAEVPPMPQNGATVKVYKKRTFGWRENACAMSTVANAKYGQAKENTMINGADTRHMASTYMSQDHVGVYGASYNFAAVVTTAASTTYTSTSITAPEITEANCVVGMYLRTKHATKYLGKVTAVNYNTKTATVDGWWTWGGGIAGTPANGTSTEINPNDKVWALNHNLILESFGDATKGSGFELGLIINKSGAGAGTWGYDCITLNSSETPYAHFISRGAKTHAFLALTGGTYGFASEANQVNFESKDPTVAAFRASVGGAVKWAINISGALERDYRKFKAVNQASYTIATDDCFIVNVYGNATLTLPAASTVGANRVYTVKANALCTVNPSRGLIDGAASKSMPAGSYNQFICDGTNWYAF